MCSFLNRTAVVFLTVFIPFGVVKSKVPLYNQMTGLDETIYPDSPYKSCDESLPNTISIKNSYQTFDDHRYFVLVDGKLCFKNRNKIDSSSTYNGEKENKSSWTLFDGDGLPKRFKKNGEVDESFELPNRFLSISADDDEIIALGDNRKVYLKRMNGNLRFEPIWYSDWGVVKKRDFYFPKKLTNQLAWGLGRRTIEGVGYTTGPDGRPYGGGGVSMDTLYFLNSDGSNLYYLDSATSPSINHQMCLPERGKYRAVNASFSASTAMVIDKFGRVKTRLGDFDHSGGTYMHRFCYNCEEVPFYNSPIDRVDGLFCSNKDTGTILQDFKVEIKNDLEVCTNDSGEINEHAVITKDYTPNFSMGISPIQLPDEPWTHHRPVIDPSLIDEDNMISKEITILQTGIGNSERELRVVGKKDGVIGYYYKKLSDEEHPVYFKVPNKKADDEYYHEKISTNNWKFIANEKSGDQGFSSTNIRWLEKSDILSTKDEIKEKISKNANGDVPMYGSIKLGRDGEFPVIVKNSNHNCSPWDMRVKVGEYEISMDFHVVHLWQPYIALESEEMTTTYQTTLILTLEDEIKEMIEKSNSELSDSQKKVKRIIKNYFGPRNMKEFDLVTFYSHKGIESYSRGIKDKITLRAYLDKSMKGKNIKSIDKKIKESLVDDNAWKQLAENFVKKASLELKEDKNDEALILKLIAENRTLQSSMKEIYKAIKLRRLKYGSSKIGLAIVNGIFRATGIRLAYNRYLNKGRFNDDETSFGELALYEAGNAIEDAPYIFHAHSTSAKVRLKASKKELKVAQDILKKNLKMLKKILKK